MSPIFVGEIRALSADVSAHLEAYGLQHFFYDDSD
jgi:hypothetical protein